MLKAELKGIDKGKRLTIDMARRVLFKSMFKMEELAIQKAPFDRGFLRQNITLFPEILADKYVLSSNAPYSADLEYGNNPRDVKLKPLIEWIERKGIRSGKNAIGFAKYVQNKIKTEGVNAQPFMRPAFYEVVNFWQDIYKEEEFQSSI